MFVASGLDFGQRHLRHRASLRFWTRRSTPLSLWPRHRQFLRLGRDRTVKELESELVSALFVLVDDHTHVPTGLQMAEQYLVCKRLLDVLLDHARHRPRTHQLIVTIGDQPAARLLRKLDSDVSVAELSLKLQHELFDHPGDNLLRKVRKGDGRIEPITG